MDNTPIGNNNSVYIYTIVALGNLIVGAITKSNIAWLIGIIAGLVAIASGIMTIREKNMAMKVHQMNMKKTEAQYKSLMRREGDKN